MPDVDFSRVPAFYHRYINLVPQHGISEALAYYPSAVQHFLRSIPEDRWPYRYAEGKWSIKEVVQHLIDAERIFSYRALRFARKDKTELPGFEENGYAAASEAGRRTSESLMAELATVQQSSVQLFGSFSEEQLEQGGKANGNAVYVRAIGFIIAGHALHHVAIIRERYGVIDAG